MMRYYYSTETNEIDEEYLDAMPTYLRTQFICNLIRDDKLEIKNLNKKYYNEEVILYSVKIFTYNIWFIPREFITESIYLETCKNCSYSIDMPKHLQNINFCFECVKIDGHMLRFIPDNFKTKKLCFEAFKKCTYSCFVSYIPNELFTDEDFCFKLIRDDPNIFKFIKEKYKTYEMCLYAIEEDFNLISNVPYKLKTKYICEIVINKQIELNFNNTQILFHVPKKFNELKKRLRIVKSNQHTRT
jgi:hypothetical protein